MSSFSFKRLSFCDIDSCSLANSELNDSSSLSSNLSIFSVFSFSGMNILIICESVFFISELSLIISSVNSLNFCSKVFSSARSVGSLSWAIISLNFCFSIFRFANSLLVSDTLLAILLISLSSSLSFSCSSFCCCLETSVSLGSRCIDVSDFIISPSRTAFFSLSSVILDSLSTLFLSRTSIKFDNSPSFFSFFSRDSATSLSLKPNPSFLLSLKPPCIAPLASAVSPSRVTNFALPIPILVATWILSTITVSEKTYWNIFLNFESNETRLIARSCTPFASLSFLTSSLVSFPLILFRGKKVAIPSLFSLRYCISSAASLSFSTTMLFILGPAATSKATEYFELTFPRSATVPYIPDFLSLSSRIFFTAKSPLENSFIVMSFALSFAVSSLSRFRLLLASEFLIDIDESSSSTLFSSKVISLNDCLLPLSSSSCSRFSFSTSITFLILSSIAPISCAILSFSLIRLCWDSLRLVISFCSSSAFLSISSTFFSVSPTLSSLFFSLNLFIFWLIVALSLFFASIRSSCDFFSALRMLILFCASSMVEFKSFLLCFILTSSDFKVSILELFLV